MLQNHFKHEQSKCNKIAQEMLKNAKDDNSKEFDLETEAMCNQYEKIL